MTQRLDYTASCQRLKSLGLADFDSPPPLPERRPLYDDPEPLGVQVFRTEVSADLSGLTLPRTFFGRSLVTNATFHGTDLSESTLCWNDFESVDFSNANLHGSDLRASLYSDVDFSCTDLSACDLRQTTFTNCRFTGANLMGAFLTLSQWTAVPLSWAQRRQVRWHLTKGPEPDGG